VAGILDHGVEVEMSKILYIDEWELISKDPFLLSHA
jgi:hypothetical protein